MTSEDTQEVKVFHSWWVVLAAAIGLFLYYGPVIVLAFGAFLKPLSEE